MSREDRSQRHGEGDDDHDGRERRRSRSTDKVGLRIGDQRGGPPARQQAGESRDQGQEEVLGQEDGRDQAWRAAGGLQQPDAPGAFRQAAADEDGHAGHGEDHE